MNEPSHPRILIACVGNVSRGDKAFGCEVAHVLTSMPVPADTTVVDFGIRCFDLVSALLGPYRAVVLVDAIERGSPPGTVYILRPTADSPPPKTEITPNLNTMDPVRMLALARSLGEITADIYIVGCEPMNPGDKIAGDMGLSHAVRSAVPRAAEVVLGLIARIGRPQMEFHTAA